MEEVGKDQIQQLEQRESQAEPELLNLLPHQKQTEQKFGRNSDVVLGAQGKPQTVEKDSDDKSFYTVSFLKSKDEKPAELVVEKADDDGEAEAAGLQT